MGRKPKNDYTLKRSVYCTPVPPSSIKPRFISDRKPMANWEAKIVIEFKNLKHGNISKHFRTLVSEIESQIKLLITC
jgi:hypothetical protein